jgi:hypothetical protein
MQDYGLGGRQIFRTGHAGSISDSVSASCAAVMPDTVTRLSRDS